MKQACLLTVLVTSALLAFAGSAFAQDEGGAPANPESGDTTSSVAASGGEASTAAAPSAAPADSSGPAKPISVSLLLGYGVSLKSGPNPWGFGFGARGGYNLDKIYLGARFAFYLGESQSTAGFKTSLNVWELGLEGGYDFDVAQGLVVRPLLNLGIASLVADVTVSGIPNVGGTGSSSVTKLYLAPGAALLYDVNDTFFVGLDARFQIILASSTAEGLIFLANGGMRF